MKNLNLTLLCPKISIAKLEKRQIIHPVLYDTLTSRGNPSSNGQLSNYSRRFGALYEFHQYNTEKDVSSQIVMNPSITFNFRSQRCRNSIDSMTGIVRLCGGSQVNLIILMMIL
jgi:hypothetical protein